MSDTLATSVSELIAESLDLDSPIEPHIPLKRLGFRWLDAIEVLIMLEEKFSIKINDNDVDRAVGFATVNDWVEWIKPILNNPRAKHA